jgi:hypothetical protein
MYAARPAATIKPNRSEHQWRSKYATPQTIVKIRANRDHHRDHLMDHSSPLHLPRSRGRFWAAVWSLSVISRLGIQDVH